MSTPHLLAPCNLALFSHFRGVVEADRRAVPGDLNFGHGDIDLESDEPDKLERKTRQSKSVEAQNVEATKVCTDEAFDRATRSV